MHPYVKRLSLLVAVLVAGIIFVPATFHGDEFDLKTYITVNQPFQVPGAELQPNTKYVLKRLDHGTTDPHVLQIKNADESQVLTTFIAISAERLEPTGKTVLTFYETAPGYARPAREWFYPGRLIGYEFIYPKEKMTEITAHLEGTQPATVQTAQAQPETFKTEPGPEQLPPDEGAIAQSAPPEIQPERPADTTVTEPESTPEQAETAAAAPEDNSMPAQLPKTAGELPILALLGLASLGLRKMF